MGKYYGEVNESGEEHGRGIKIWNDGDIWIGYFDNGWYYTGNYIDIRSNGTFYVGEMYLKDEEKWERGTQYDTDGTEEQYD